MQKLPYEEFQFTATTILDVMLKTDDDSSYGYYMFCDIDYNDICTEKTEQQAQMAF